MWRAAVIVAICLALPSICAGTPAVRRPLSGDIFSPNGLFVIHVNPQTKENKVFHINDREKLLWSFSELLVYGRGFLADDGSAFVAVQGAYLYDFEIETGDCMKFWTKDGSKRYGFVDLVSDAARDSVMERWPFGWWSTVSAHPRRWYTEVDQRGDVIRVRTTDIYDYTFSLADGSIIEQRIVFSNFLYKPWFCLVLVGIAGISVAYGVRVIRRKRALSSPPAKTEAQSST